VLAISTNLMVNLHTFLDRWLCTKGTMADKEMCASPGMVLPVPRAASGWHRHIVISLMKRKVPPMRRTLRLPSPSWRLTSDSSRSGCAHLILQVFGLCGASAQLCRSQLQMQAMGFGKAKAREALQASHHSLDGAIEWLMANTI